MKKMLLCFVLLSAVVFGLYSCKEGGGSSSDTPSPNSPNHPTATAWTMTTPAGITVSTERSTIAQYNTHWELNIANAQTWKWEDIDWITLDEAFAIFKEFYCNHLGWDCKDAQPYELTIYVKPWDSRCVDVETPSQPYEIYEYINGGWNCIDGWLSPGDKTIYFHFGDDPGTDHETTYEGKTTSYFAFEETALPDELRHFFQMKAGRELANNSDPTPPIHQIMTTVGYKIILPEEEETEETN